MFIILLHVIVLQAPSGESSQGCSEALPAPVGGAGASTSLRESKTKPQIPKLILTSPQFHYP